MKLSKGREFHGPGGQGYRLSCDVTTGDIIMADQFEPFGGAPTPESGKMLPLWLAEQIEAEAAHQAVVHGNAILGAQA